MNELELKLEMLRKGLEDATLSEVYEQFYLHFITKHKVEETNCEAIPVYDIDGACVDVEAFLETFACPNCNTVLLCGEFDSIDELKAEEINYCPKCGTALDWNIDD